MKKKATFIPDCKKRGEWAEVQFLAQAEERGLTVSKPWGDSARYDFAIEHHGKFLRVQVKSTIARFCDGYVCSLKSSRGQYYTCEQVDFFAVYVIPEDAWYIMPAEVITRLKGHFLLAPRRKGQKYERYLEAWHLLCAEDTTPEPAQPVPHRSPADHAGQSPGLREDSAPDCHGLPRPGIPGPPDSAGTERETETSGAPDSDGLVRKRLQDCFDRIRSRGPFNR